MKRILILSGIIFLFCGLQTRAARELRGIFTDSSLYNKQIFLWETLGNHSYIVDSAKISTNGNFEFQTGLLPDGYYFLSINDTSRADIILSSSEQLVLIEFSSPRLQHGVKIVSSLENQLLWEYKLISKSVYQELKYIYIGKSNIPVPPLTKADSSALQAFQQVEDSLNAHKLKHLKRICDNNPNTFFARSAKASLKKEFSSKDEEKLHFFDMVDFSDASLIRSNSFPLAMMEYLQKYTEYHEEGFKSSVDTILLKARANTDVFEFCLNYLLELFDKVGPDVIFQYLSEKYLLAEGCSDAAISKTFKEKAEAYRILLPGNKAPDLAFENDFRLSEFAAKNKITVLFFWSSHCNFCHQAIPDLKGLFAKYNSSGLQIVAVSLDENKNDWEKYIQQNDLNWTNLCDLKGWKSDAVNRFKIHKTPSFYILDKNLEILSKPASVKALNDEVQKFIK